MVIATFQTKLEEREQEIAREKEHASDLRSELEKAHNLRDQEIQFVIANSKELVEMSRRSDEK